MAGRRRHTKPRPPVDAEPKSSAPPPGRFRDMVLTCETCGRTFVFTVEEQRRLAEAGLPVEPPRECARCAPRAEPASAPAPPLPVEPAPARVHAPAPAPVAAHDEAPHVRLAPPHAGDEAPHSRPAPAPRPRRPEPERDPFAGMYTVRSLGHVKWYDVQKGYGFVSDDDSGQEYFVHQSALEGGLTELVEGQAVEFELERKAKGDEAAHVLPL